MKSKKWMMRLLFLLLLLSAGFGIEYILYRLKPNNQSFTPEDKGKKKILIIGGSISRNIKDGMNSFLYSKKLDNKYSISSLAMSQLQTDSLLSHFERILKTYDPHVIYLLIGMNENFDEQKIGALNLRVARKLELTSLIQQGKRKEFNDALLKWLLDYNEKSDPKSLFYLRSFVITNVRSYATFFDHKKIVSTLSEKILDQLKSKEKCQQCLYELVVIAKALTPTPWKAFGIDRPYQADRDANEKNIKSFRKNLEILITEGVNKINKNGPIEFLNNDGFFTFLDRAWLVTSWNPELMKDSSIAYYNEHATYFSAYLDVIVILKGLKSESLSGSSGIKLPNSLEKYFPPKEGPDDVPPAFYGNLQKIKNICNEKNITLILLQYPNSHKKYIERAGRTLGLQVIENKKNFEGLINESNREKYFYDKIEDSGHMTTRATVIYGKSLILQSPNIFPEINAANSQ